MTPLPHLPTQGVIRQVRIAIGNKSGTECSQVMDLCGNTVMTPLPYVPTQGVIRQVRIRMGNKSGTEHSANSAVLFKLSWKLRGEVFCEHPSSCCSLISRTVWSVWWIKLSSPVPAKDLRAFSVGGSPLASGFSVGAGAAVHDGLHFWSGSPGWRGSGWKD